MTNDLTVSGGTEDNVAAQNPARLEEFLYQSGAADIVDVPVREQQLSEVIYSLAAQKRFQDEVRRGFVAGVHQEIAGATRSLDIHRFAAVQRHNRDASKRAFVTPLQKPPRR